MASILFLGYSNLVKGRILPILSKMGVTEVSIAKFAGQPWDDDYQKCGLPVTRYDNYEDGLANFKGNLVYVSTVNSTHVEYARKSLQAGFNTIIDKPATMNYQEAEELVALAKSKGLFVGESTVYLKHPQLSVIKDIYKKNGDEPKLLTVHFTMPPFKPENFRYQKSLGGGAIMDTAPYAVSIGRYFFGSKPNKVSCVVSERQHDGLDIEYSLLMSYPNGKTMIGHFGFNTEYINQVHLMGNRTNVLVDRIFTIPDTLENELQVRHMNEASVVKTPSGNTFEIYLRDSIKQIEEKNYEQAYQDLLWDAEVKNMIFESIK
jgi:predicted dehydrogenase